MRKEGREGKGKGINRKTRSNKRTKERKRNETIIKLLGSVRRMRRKYKREEEGNN